MTNREWLNSLTDEDFYNVLRFDCTYPSLYGCLFGRCDKDGDCKKCKLKWLKSEHKESKRKRG